MIRLDDPSLIDRVLPIVNGVFSAFPLVMACFAAIILSNLPFQMNPVSPVERTLAEQPKVPKITHFSARTSFNIAEAGYAPSLSPEAIDDILKEAKSPLQGLGPTIYRYSIEYGIDPAFMLALWTRENRLGTVPGVATQGYNIGSIVDTGGLYDEIGTVPGTLGLTFGKYADWEQGIRANYMLLAREYIPEGRDTPRSLTNVYSSNEKGDSQSWGDEVAIIADRFLREYGDDREPLLPLVRWIYPPLEDGIRDALIRFEDRWPMLTENLDRLPVLEGTIVLIAATGTAFWVWRRRKCRDTNKQPATLSESVSEPTQFAKAK